jgi:NADH-quinone oxidoreductase subunit L
LYAFRMVFLTFFGQEKKSPTQPPGLLMTIPLIVLSILSIVGGFIELPADMGHFALFSEFINKTLPPTVENSVGNNTEMLFQVISGLVALAGIGIAYKYYFDKPFPAAEPKRNAIQTFFYSGWDFDLLYNTLLVRPVVYLSQIDKNDFIDRFYTALASLTMLLNKLLSATQNGRLRRYAMVLAIGAIITLTIILYL